MLGERLQAIGRLIERCVDVSISAWLLGLLPLLLLHVLGFEKAENVLGPLFGLLFLVSIAGCMMLPVARWIARYRRRITTTVIEPGELRGQEYVLYLRSFEADARAYHHPRTHMVYLSEDSRGNLASSSVRSRRSIQ